MIFTSLFGTIVVAGIVGALSERTGFTHNGVLQSVIICIGGAIIAYFVQVMFGIGFRHPGWTAVAASIGALIIVPFHWRK